MAGVPSHDRSKWGPEISAQAVLSEMGRRCQKRTELLDVNLASDCRRIPASDKDVCGAFQQIMRKSRLGDYGVFVGSVIMVAHARQNTVAAFFQFALGSTATMSNISIHGRVQGRTSSACAANSLRSILPLPAVMQVIGAIWPAVLETQ